MLENLDERAARLSTWLTKDQAARKLGVKPRMIVEFVSRKQLTPQKYQRPNTGGGPISLFDPEQVDALLQARANARMEALPPGAPGPLAHTYRVDARRIAPPDAALDQPAPAAAPLVDIKDRLCLTLTEAAAYTGMGKSYIAANAPALDGGPHGSKVYRRADLKAWIEGLQAR